MPKSNAPLSAGLEDSQTNAKASDSTMRVLRRFRVVFNAVKAHFQQVEKRLGIGGAQVWALSLIAAGPGLSVGQLAKQMDIHQATASNLVRSLLGADLVQAVRDGTDRRTVRLSATSQGRALLRKAPGPFAGVLPEALAQLDRDTLDRLDKDLGRLIETLKADPRGAGVPLAQL